MSEKERAFGAVRAKMAEKEIVDFSDAELERALGGCGGRRFCLAAAREMITKGLTLDALYAEFPSHRDGVANAA